MDTTAGNGIGTPDGAETNGGAGCSNMDEVLKQGDQVFWRCLQNVDVQVNMSHGTAPCC